MSVLSPIVSLWDGENRRAYLAEGASDYYPIEDLYHEYRNARRNNHELRKYNALLRAEGNIKKGGGAFTPRYVVLLDGFKIIPFNETLQLNQLGDMITDDPDTDATLYDVSGLTVAKPIFIKPSNAETVQLNSESIVFSSFQGAVWVNVDSQYGDKGSATLPNGNTERPVNTIQLAVQIAYERGFTTIQVIGSLDLDADCDVRGFLIKGTSHLNSILTVGSACLCENTRFESFDITGVLDGGSEIRDCIVRDIAFFNGSIDNCRLAGIITLAGNTDAHMKNCSMLGFDDVPTINCGGSGQNLVMSEYSARIKVTNLTGASTIGIGLASGGIIIDSNCTAGKIICNGNGSVDYSAKGINCNVVDRLTSGREISNMHRQLALQADHHTATGNMWFWDPYGGNDDWDGEAKDTAFKTFAKAHDSCLNAHHDTIVIVPGNPTGETVITENMYVTKDYLFIEGPGRDIVARYTVEGDGIFTSARGTKFSGFRIENTAPNATGIHSTGVFTLIDNMFLESCTAGILIEAGYPVIRDVRIPSAIEYGIKFLGAVSASELEDVSVGNCQGDGVVVDLSAGSGGMRCRALSVVGNQGYGVTIGATSARVLIDSSCMIQDNTLGNVDDNGIFTVDKSMMPTPEAITSSVWSATDRTLTGDTGLSEADLHNGLDSYENKGNWRDGYTDLEIDAILDTIVAKDNFGSSDRTTLNALVNYDDTAIDAKISALAIAIAAIPIDELTTAQNDKLMSLINADFTETNAKVDNVPDDLLGKVI